MRVKNPYHLDTCQKIYLVIIIVGFKNSAFQEILKGYPYPELLVKSRDVNKLAWALEKIIEDKNIRQEISSWLIKESKKYNWEKIAKETEEFYYQVLSS